jgi:hypothetical protein
MNLALKKTDFVEFKYKKKLARYRAFLCRTVMAY